MAPKGEKKRATQAAKVQPPPDLDPGYTWTCSWNTLQSHKNGIFSSIFEGVEESLSKRQMTAFGALDSEYKRVVYLVSLDVVQNLAPVPMFRRKDPKETGALLAQAESCLEKGSAGTALNLLSRAITKAPSADGETVSRLLALRSRALSNLQQHELALRDTQLALSGRVPDAYARAQLLRTQGRSYFSLGDQIRAKLAYVSAERLLQDSQRPEFKQLRQQLQQEVELCQNAPPTPPDDQKSHSTSPELTGGANKQLPHTSSLVGVKESPEAGRFIVAKSKIDAGDVLAVEPAYCSVLLMDRAGTHCHHCMARLVAPIACPNCSGVAFCSRECQEAACKTYHKAECQFLNLFIGLGMSVLCHLALRIITRTGSVKAFLKLWDEAHAAPAKSPEAGDYARFLRLVSHDAQRQPRDQLGRTLMAIFLLKCLKGCDDFWAGDLSAQEECRVGEALLRHISILQFNSHEVFETLAWQRTQIKGTRTQYIGVGVYLSVALFNHDCNPAVARCYQGTKMVLHALRPLQPGESIGENYGPIFTKMSLGQRQRTLRSRYWFRCGCRACLENWNTFEVGINSTVKTENAQKMFDMGLESLEQGKLEGAIYLLTEFINNIDGKVILPDREVCLAIDSLRLCLMSVWGTVVEVQPPKSTADEAGSGADAANSIQALQITELTEEDQVD